MPTAVNDSRKRGGVGMSKFALRYPFFIIMLCMIVAVVGTVTVARMPVDLFPEIKIPVVVVATFYSGMPPEQIETHITNPVRAVLHAGQRHRSYRVAVYDRRKPDQGLLPARHRSGRRRHHHLQPGHGAACAACRRARCRPWFCAFDASSMPVCFVTLKGKGLNETQLHDLGQYEVRDQIAGVPGASIPPPFGGKYRQIQVYVDPVKLEAHELSPMDVVRAVNQANQILPSGDVRIGPNDYNIYADSQMPTMKRYRPGCRCRSVGNGQLLVSDVGYAKDDSRDPDQHRARRRPALGLSAHPQAGRRKQHDRGGQRHSRSTSSICFDVPKSLVASVIFDQSVFVKTAIANLGSEGGIGVLLTAVMILIFLGSMRATVAVMLSIPLSALAAFIILNSMGATINAMVLGGLALAFSRLIDNSVVVLENIFRHLEMGEPPDRGRRKGRPRDGASRSGRNLHHRHCLLPGCLSLRSQPVPVYRHGALCRAVALRLLCRGHDRGSALLRALHSQRASSRPAITRAATRFWSLCAGSIAAMTRC